MQRRSQFALNMRLHKVAFGRFLSWVPEPLRG